MGRYLQIVCSRSSAFTGFFRNSSKPFARYISLAPATAFAVSAITGVSLFGKSVCIASCFISCSVSIPSISGIIWSIKIIWNFCFCTYARHCFPDSAVTTCSFVRFNSALNTVRFIVLSSTTSTRPCGAVKPLCFLPLYRVFFSCISRKLPAGSLLIIFCGIMTVKVEPFWYSLSTFISPPIILSSDIVIFMPSPVPSMFLFFSSSRRWKLSKSFPISSFRIPMPVSCTDIFSSSPSPLWRSYVMFSFTLP